MTTPLPPSNPTERELEKLQKKVTEGEIAKARMEAIAFDMWVNHEHTQSDIQGRLDRADRNAGGNGVTMARVQKMLWRLRRADQAAHIG